MTWVPTAAAELTGQTRESLLADAAWASRFSGANYDAMLAICREVSEHGGRQTLEHRVLAGAGAGVWLSTEVQIYEDAGRRLILGRMTEVPVRRELSDDVRGSRREQQAISTRSPR